MARVPWAQRASLAKPRDRIALFNVSGGIGRANQAYARFPIDTVRQVLSGDLC